MVATISRWPSSSRVRLLQAANTCEQNGYVRERRQLESSGWSQISALDRDISRKIARVLPFFEEYDVKLLRVLTDRGSEFCGNPERHEYELYLAVEDIDHSRTKTKSPQTNGICERFHKTVLNEFYRVAFRKKVYRSTDELQADLDAWIKDYNAERPHQGRWCFGKTPIQTFLDAMLMTKERRFTASGSRTGS